MAVECPRSPHACAWRLCWEVQSVRHQTLLRSFQHNPQPLCTVQLSVGSIRSKNAKNIVLKNLLDACFGAIFFYLLGYGFAYDGPKSRGNKFMSYGPFALRDEPISAWGGWFFQFAVRLSCVALVCLHARPWYYEAFWLTLWTVTALRS